MSVKRIEFLLSGATVCTTEGTYPADILITNGIISEIASDIPKGPDMTVLQLKNYHIFPGFVDVHVHLRQPGFSYKETVRTGTEAAARGGYTTVCSMPNLNPPPDSLPHLEQQLEFIKQDAVINVIPYGTITEEQKGEELADFAALADKVAAFSDDGYGVQCADIMEAAMRKAKKHGKIIAAHCEDESLLGGGYIHDGVYAKSHGHAGISSESEWKQLARDLELAAKTEAAYHVCHISAKESVELVRKAKARGLDITCEVTPHHLLLCDEDLQDDGCFKMNPPLRGKSDTKALVTGLLDGTIDMIATDHAPHSMEEKSKGLRDSAMGIVGLETAFQVLYTNIVKTGMSALEELIGWIHQKPMERFNVGTPLKVGQPANLCVFDLNREYVLSPESFLSKGKSTPFAGMKVQGACLLTMVNGKVVWSEESRTPL